MNSGPSPSLKNKVQTGSQNSKNGSFEKMGEPFKRAEKNQDFILKKQEPVIIRIDGRAFHTYVKKAGFQKPFDHILHGSMMAAAKAICKDAQNSRLAYVQSDEMSILLYEKTEIAESWFNNRVNKLCSVSSSIATAYFNEAVGRSRSHFAFFDARAFNLIPNQVRAYFSWRQADAFRNSISMLAQDNFSHKELHGKNRREMQDMLNDVGISWLDLESWKRHGSTIIKKKREFRNDDGAIYHRTVWENQIDHPLFKDYDRFNEVYLTRSTT